MQFDPVLLTEVDGYEKGILDWGKYRIAFLNCKNKEKSPHNEDSLFINFKGSHLIAGVSDGAGGHPKGKEAAKIAASLMFKSCQNSKSNFLKVIQEINSQIIDLKVGAGATLASVSIKDDSVRFFSVGDSEIILWNSQGREIYSNIPSTTIGHKIEAGLLEQNESLEDPDRHQVNNMLGETLIRIEATNRIELKKYHTLLVGSDGVFDNFTHEELKEMVGTGPFDQSFNSFADQCINSDNLPRNKDDDISFILIRKISS